jgi:ADP-ribose pyrophosphatase YjhB (NUDIX family)
MTAKFTLGAFAIILNEYDRVLLCHRTDKDKWNAPGGQINDHESR